MSRWTHSICEGCWEKRDPNREPVRVKDREVEIYCFCGLTHASGIYVREDPAKTLCRGTFFHDA
jgi:hypothetical protein